MRRSAQYGLWPIAPYYELPALRSQAGQNKNPNDAANAAAPAAT
jgi:hypothetical protein